MFNTLLNFIGLRRLTGLENTPTESWVMKLIREASTSMAGSGVSSTKLVWLSNGMLSCYCATLATMGGVGVYVFLQKADGIYWTAVGALWVNALGFATSAKKHQNLTKKEITLASQQTEKQRTENEGGTP
jgi:hypothetical protein